jgi:hypothetical protein
MVRYIGPAPVISSASSCPRVNETLYCIDGILILRDASVRLAYLLLILSQGRCSAKPDSGNDALESADYFAIPDQKLRLVSQRCLANPKPLKLRGSLGKTAQYYLTKTRSK